MSSRNILYSSWNSSLLHVSLKQWRCILTGADFLGCPSLTRWFASTHVFPAVLTYHFVFAGGPIHVTFPSSLTLKQVQRKNPLVVRGGRYRPPDCEARHRTAIIIPHRHREHHLRFLLYYLHPFLQRQQLQYGIYIIHQVKNKQRNLCVFICVCHICNEAIKTKLSKIFVSS